MMEWVAAGVCGDASIDSAAWDAMKYCATSMHQVNIWKNSIGYITCSRYRLVCACDCAHFPRLYLRVLVLADACIKQQVLSMSCRRLGYLANVQRYSHDYSDAKTRTWVYWAGIEVKWGKDSVSYAKMSTVCLISDHLQQASTKFDAFYSYNECAHIRFLITQNCSNSCVLQSNNCNIAQLTFPLRGITSQLHFWREKKYKASIKKNMKWIHKQSARVKLKNQILPFKAICFVFNRRNPFAKNQKHIACMHLGISSNSKYVHANQATKYPA